MYPYLLQAMIQFFFLPLFITITDCHFFPCLFLLKGRCYHCECEGAKIVHPDLEKYNGRTDFLEMARDKSSGTTTEDVISRCEYLHDAVDICEEDCVCFDASWDVECAEFLNSRAANKIRLEQY